MSSALLGEIVQDLDGHHEITAPQRNVLRVGGGRARQDLGNVQHPWYLVLSADLKPREDGGHLKPFIEGHGSRSRRMFAGSTGHTLVDIQRRGSKVHP
jgi:hypothetical protein